ncbi:hypothetical protein NP493_1287g02039 [Ridgeia piscesae]|uniref:Uncharacterized protein n=1 Tax=Ridgeia piscesae TaxID=27915 RepID=A0AAD9NED2_RIDPI|nr:hypothetical protein NP493_1287g02039 [Ridgeia piscesae]
MEAHFDEYEHWNFDFDRHMFSGHSGKGRSKKEASQHTNHHDPSGHTRKVLTKLCGLSYWLTYMQWDLLLYVAVREDKGGWTSDISV